MSEYFSSSDHVTQEWGRYTFRLMVKAESIQSYQMTWQVSRDDKQLFANLFARLMEFRDLGENNE